MAIEDMIATKPLSREVENLVLSQFEPAAKRFAADVFNRFTNPRCELADLINRARYHPKRGPKFITYLTARVPCKLMQDMYNMMSVVKVGRNLWKSTLPDGLREKRDKALHAGAFPADFDLPSPTDATPLDQDEIERLHGAVSNLPPRQRLVVCCRFLRREPMTLAAVGRDIGITKERVRQIEGEALRLLRTSLEGGA